MTQSKLKLLIDLPLLFFKIFWTCLLLIILDLIDFIEYKLEAKRIYNILKPNCLMVLRDRNLGVQTALMKLIKKNSGFTALIPWGYPNTAYLIRSRQQSKRNQLNGIHTSLIQKILKLIKHNQIFKWEGIYYSYYKPGRFLAAKILNWCPSNPWVYGEDSDIAFYDSKYTLEHLHGNIIHYHQ